VSAEAPFNLFNYHLFFDPATEPPEPPHTLLPHNTALQLLLYTRTNAMNRDE